MNAVHLTDVLLGLFDWACFYVQADFTLLLITKEVYANGEYPTQIAFVCKCEYHTVLIVRNDFLVASFGSATMVFYLISGFNINIFIIVAGRYHSPDGHSESSGMPLSFLLMLAST